jgi:hypothetical protein
VLDADAPASALGWCPQRAAASFVGAADLTTANLREKLRSLVLAAGCLLP